MKQFWILILSLLITSALLASGVTAKVQTSQNHNNGNRYEVVAYEENFEGAATGWTHYDGAVAPSNWHIYNDGGNQGNVWWMGDPALATGDNIGGYYDSQYLVLDTPQILVPTSNPTLTFKMKYKVETPGSSPDSPEYNGWDSFNIRISIDNGATWTTVSGSPTYSFTSSFAFGGEHGEGVNIPAWGGATNDWVNASFNLNNYAGQNVKVRFAFASDPAVSTGDDATLFGVMVDDIVLGSFSNNGVDNGQMTWMSMVPLGGDLWHIATADNAPSPTHAMICQNASGGYNPNMLNYLISPPIILPESGDIKADFNLYCNLTDTDYTSSAPLSICDYFGFEISINNGQTWFNMSNPYDLPPNPPLVNNYVYISEMEAWSLMTESFDLDGLISDYAGETVKFRIYVKSDSDAPSGLGFMLDNFKIINEIFLPEPSSLTALINGSTVNLTWSSPGGGGEPGWLTYSSDLNLGAVGSQDGSGDMEVAARWAPAGVNSILPYIGMNITQIMFWPSVAGLTYTVRIYTGAAGNTVYSQVVTNPLIGEWNTVTLTTPFTVPSGTYVWVGYLCTIAAGQYPAGYDDTPAVTGFGDMIRFGGPAWSPMGGDGGNWNIKAYVTDATGRTMVMGQSNSERNRELSSYKIYRDDVEVGNVSPDTLTFTDTNVPGGLHHYKITAMYGQYESLPSNIITSYVLPLNYVEMGFDDGTSEFGFNAGPNNFMAVKFQHNERVTLRYAKVYISQIGTNPMYIRVYDDTGIDGMPGSQHITQVIYPVASMVEGWNYVPIATTTPLTIEDGSYYLSIFEPLNASAVGFDTSSNGHSYKKTPAGWEALTDGEILLRSIVQTGIIANDDQAIVPLTITASNYPNPFNPETSISYTVPKDGQTKLTIYNTKGQIVRSLLNSKVKAGNYKVSWNGTDEMNKAVASGIYFYRLENNHRIVTRKMLLTR